MLELSFFQICFQSHPAFRQIARRDFHCRHHTHHERQAQLTLPPRQMPDQPMSIWQFDVRQPGTPHIDYSAFDRKGTFSRHVSISGSDSVTSTVCSK